MRGGPLGRIAAKLNHDRAEKVAVVRLEGAIGHGGGPGAGRGMTTTSVEPVLKRAFGTEHLRAVVIVINSPGGSPAQSEYIAERIRQLASEKNVPVLAFCEDIVASGGYWIACAADEIYAAHTSIVGSIGVVSSGFGFGDLLSRFGVERRLHFAGENKVRLDAFSPEQPDDVAWLEGLQGDLHEAFKAWVRQRRGKRLTVEDASVFSGDVWVGQKAAEVGLVDGIGVMRSVVAERYPDAEIESVDAPRPLLSRLVGDQFEASALAEQVLTGAMSAVHRWQDVRFR
ncbi:S49 family peptidase [Gordonia sp. NB41Y]|uniref:S49 family peptidase n=1 Tax=Gordonia sp. NB41Y TaxID=875808 RepID=UPI0002BE33B5|nr:S49 family peptidase [Gordonia sp. NB41Y]EMP11836.1 peptidase S49 [Gordonia sp. NB41Y]WLP92773.1 S49 family peptidase [Gordonia sp. NB41Y]